MDLLPGIIPRERVWFWIRVMEEKGLGIVARDAARLLMWPPAESVQQLAEKWVRSKYDGPALSDEEQAAAARLPEVLKIAWQYAAAETLPVVQPD